MESRLDKAIKYAMDHMPMKHYAVIVAKSASEMDEEEQAAVASIGGHKFYASVSITVGRKEILETGYSDCDRLGAVCRAFARLHLATVTNRSQFKVSEEFSNQFLAGMAQE